MKTGDIEFVFEYNSSDNAPTFLEVTEQLIGIKSNNVENLSSAA